MVNDPVLLIPAFRSGRETPWAGDVLRHEYEKYTLGNMIGESYDFSVLSTLESTLPNGMPLSAHLNHLGYDEKTLPFLIKWIDADKATSMHVHPYDEYLYIVKVQADSAIVCGLSSDFMQNDPAKDTVFSDGDHALSVFPGDFIHIPAGTAHALHGITCCLIQPHRNESLRLYDWDRTNSRGQKRSLQLEKALPILTDQKAMRLIPDGNMLVSTESFQIFSITQAVRQPLAFDGSFAVLTCLHSAVLTLASGRLLYLPKGQSVFVPQSDSPCTLTANHCLLTICKE